jgi:hypothetical protein
MSILLSTHPRYGQAGQRTVGRDYERIIKKQWWKNGKKCLFFPNDFLSFEKKRGRDPLFLWFGGSAQLDLIGRLQ